MILNAVCWDQVSWNNIKLQTHKFHGFSGVPYFIMNGQKVFSGAQGPDTIIRMFEIVSERFPLETSATPPASM